jgi:hypothetical protein
VTSTSNPGQAPWPKILVSDNPLNASEVMRELAPAGFDVVLARAGSPEWNEALHDVEYLARLGGVKMDDAFYKSAPKLKLVQLSQYRLRPR